MSLWFCRQHFGYYYVLFGGVLIFVTPRRLNLVAFSLLQPSHYSVVQSGIFSFYYSVKTNSSSLVVLDLGSCFNFAAPRKLNTATVVDRISVLLLRRNLISIVCIAFMVFRLFVQYVFILCQLFVDYVLAECNYMVCCKVIASMVRN